MSNHVAEAPATQQCLLLYCETATGIVLTIDKQRWTRGQDRPYIVFESIAAARGFALATIASEPLIECALFTAHHTWIETLRPQYTLPPAKKPWWRFWR